MRQGWSDHLSNKSSLPRQTKHSMKVQARVKNWLLELNNCSGWLSKTVESHARNGTHKHTTVSPTSPFPPTFRVSFLPWDPTSDTAGGPDPSCTSSNVLPGVLSRVGEGCWAAMIKEALMLPGRHFPCHRAWWSWSWIAWPVPWTVTLSWEWTCSLTCGREGTKGCTVILTRAATLPDLWLKERKRSASSPPEPKKLLVVNN